MWYINDGVIKDAIGTKQYKMIDVSNIIYSFLLQLYTNTISEEKWEEIWFIPMTNDTTNIN